MELKRTLWAIVCNIFSIITFNRYYICDACHKVHKRTGDEFEFRGRIFVSRKCANETIQKACAVLRNDLLKTLAK